MLQLIIGLIIGLIISITIFFLYKKFLEKQTKTVFEDFSHKTFKELIPSFLHLAKQELSNVRQEIDKDVNKEKTLIQESLEKLEKNIKEKQDEIKLLEQERNRQFGSVAESIKNHKEIAEKLSEKTENLTKILRDNKLRGNWGERQAEDIMQYAGLIHGIHYLKAETLASSGTVPDFTIQLPNGRKINLDVKFPFTNLQAYQEAESENQKKECIKKFENDVKTKLREVTSRSYISEEENTLDYVILFVPSEAIYSFINNQLKNVVDEGLQKKVLITSPSSLYATLRIIMEAYRYFAYEKNIKEILAIIQGFIDNFRRFQEEFSGFDVALNKLRKTYDDIANTRYKMINAQIKKIEKLEQFQKFSIIEKTNSAENNQMRLSS
jgi:DNA recombination protein RmuC